MIRNKSRKKNHLIMDNNEQTMKTIQPQKVVIKPSMDITNGHLFQVEPESLLVLQDIAKQFQCGRIYKEKEVNELLKPFYDDYVTLRRYLIEHGLLSRNRDGSQYWLEKGK